MLNFDNVFDFYLVLNVKRLLGCSLATTYRTLGRAKITAYFIPNHASGALIPVSSLWRLASTPAWRKHLKRIGYRMPKKRLLKQFTKLHRQSDIAIWHSQGLFSPLTLPEVISAADNGLIPCDSVYNCPNWFYAVLSGLLILPLPRKLEYGRS